MCVCNPSIRTPYCKSITCQEAMKVALESSFCDKCDKPFLRDDISFNIGADMHMCRKCSANYDIAYLRFDYANLLGEISKKNRELEKIKLEISKLESIINA